MGGFLDRAKRFVPTPVKRVLRGPRGGSPAAPVPPQVATSGEEAWHRQAVGGLWGEMGRLQFDYLLSQGLEPEHFLLDVGCGSLRGGVHFVRYLKEGHYYGIDVDPRLLEGGRQELRQLGLLARRPVLVEMGDFRFAELDRRFEFALAQSVFTHLPLNSIIRCLLEIQEVLVPGGQFFATFFENFGGRGHLEPIEHPTADGSRIVSHFDRDPYHYDAGIFRWICEGTALEVEHVGEWGHPRDQRMLRFTRR